MYVAGDTSLKLEVTDLGNITERTDSPKAMGGRSTSKV